jgi:hypothetical protein
MRRAALVDCQVVRERDFKLIGTRGVDMSPHGMLVLAQGDRIMTGEPVIVAFRLGGSGWWFDSLATVARVLHGRRPGDVGRCFGIEFDPLEPDVQSFIRRALRGVPPPLPMREPRIDYAASVHLAALS